MNYLVELLLRGTPNIVFEGGLGGDEGKGGVNNATINMLVRLVEEIVKMMIRIGAIVSPQGGTNAGHTTVNPYGPSDRAGEYKLHHIPAGIFTDYLTILGSDKVIDMEELWEHEILQLMSRGIDINPGKLLISGRAILNGPWSKVIERIEEEEKGKDAIGTTLRGIGGAYQDKANRHLAIPLYLLKDPKRFREAVVRVLTEKNLLLVRRYGREPMPADTLEKLMYYAEKLAPYVGHAEERIWQLQDEGKSIIVEMTQGMAIDLTYGEIPNVTSSFTTIGGAIHGAGIGPDVLTIIVYKAFLSRVGHSNIPTIRPEFQELDAVHQEKGTTTGRKRPLSWFDAPIARLSARLSGYIKGREGRLGFALTKLDVLDGVNPVKICTHYLRGDEVIEIAPLWDPELLRECQPVFEELPGWEATAGVTDFGSLHPNAKAYVRRISELTGLPPLMVRTGAESDSTIFLTKEEATS